MQINDNKQQYDEFNQKQVGCIFKTTQDRMELSVGEKGIISVAFKYFSNINDRGSQEPPKIKGFLASRRYAPLQVNTSTGQYWIKVNRNSLTKQVRLSNKELKDAKNLRELINQRIAPSNQANSALENAVRQRENQMNKFRRDPKAKSQEIYQKIFNKSNMELKEVTAFNSTMAISSYLEDLKSFKSDTRVKISNEEMKRLDCAIEELEFAYQIGIKMEALHILKDKTCEGEPAKEVVKKLTELPVGSSLLLPGGYQKTDHEGHTVMYRIKKELSGAYSFTIINTGEGVDINEKISDSFLNIARSLVNQPGQYKDKKYIGVPKAKLDEKFISDLLKLAFTNDKNSTIEGVYKKIQEQIAIPGNLTEGRTHQAQRKENCSFKSVASCIHETLGNDLHKLFKVHVTKSGIDILEQMVKDLIKKDVSTARYLITLQEEANEILKRQIGKL